MKKSFKAWMSLLLSSRWPSVRHLSMLRRNYKIQLDVAQLRAISDIVTQKKQCKMLVFGMGNDSSFWKCLNRRGKTVFLENNADWFDKTLGSLANMEAYLVDYKTNVSDWQKLLDSPSLLEMPLPGEVEQITWDVILVDGPLGHRDGYPGRMKSIFLASRLIKSSGSVFVHDCNRPVEDIYCNTFLKSENLIDEVDGGYGLLRHYRSGVK